VEIDPVDVAPEAEPVVLDAHDGEAAHHDVVVPTPAPPVSRSPTARCCSAGIGQPRCAGPRARNDPGRVGNLDRLSRAYGLTTWEVSERPDVSLDTSGPDPSPRHGRGVPDSWSGHDHPLRRLTAVSAGDAGQMGMRQVGDLYCPTRHDQF
jgi:hypothetical protein